MSVWKFKSWPILVVALLSLLGGCATVPMASLDKDNQAKTFQAPPQASRIYIYRNENMGGAIPMAVSVDGKTVGQTGPKTYFMLDVAPGKHRIESLTENVASLTLNTEQGKSYYVWQEVKMGLWSARSALHEVSAAQGQKGVMECKLAQSEEQ
ncbi:MAG TPA: DUF2846 domain-containing protein [Mariprofundaceae bacterium]|nr:DUF2846 domain-containing protein [Mariprofundaceae bacterium]